MGAYNKRYQVIEIYGLLALDIVVITVSYLLAYCFRFAGINTAFKAEDSVFQQMFIIACCICLIYNVLVDGYRNFFQRGYFQELIYNIKFNIALFLLASAWVYVFRLEDDFSRLVLGYFVCINAVMNYFAKICFKQFMLKIFKKSKDSDKILIVTEESVISNVLEHLEEDSGWSYEIIGIAVIDAERVGERVGDYTIIAGKEDIVEVSRQLPLDAVFFDCPSINNCDMKQLIQSFLAMGTVCHYCRDYLMLDGVSGRHGNFASFAVTTYTINVVDYRKRLIKKVMDVCGGIVGCVITLVVLPFVALAIKIESKGPIIFKQTRIGKNGRRFTMYKFRSMYVDAEERKKELVEANEVSGLMFKIENDPRITKVGAFLRRTSIDELPQFFNILKGEMSLVGTRPPTVDEFEQYNVYYRRRLSTTPGLTGLWQVSGRSNIKDFEQVVKLDLQYIDNWSLGGDIKILLQTVGVVLFRKGSR